MSFIGGRNRQPLTHLAQSDAVSASQGMPALVLSRADVSFLKTDGVKGGIFSLWRSDEKITLALSISCSVLFQFSGSVLIFSHGKGCLS